MPNLAPKQPLSATAVAGGSFAVLALIYIALIAVVMSYAALTVEFAHSVRTEEAAVAEFEAAYLAEVAEITAVDYVAAGYAKPAAERHVPAQSVTAVRGR